jgi:hypothetical protein
MAIQVQLDPAAPGFGTVSRLLRHGGSPLLPRAGWQAFRQVHQMRRAGKGKGHIFVTSKSRRVPRRAHGPPPVPPAFWLCQPVAAPALQPAPAASAVTLR